MGPANAVKKKLAASTLLRTTLKIDAKGVGQGMDRLVIEEPLEVQVNGSPYALFMRMPGEDVTLALGHCYTTGVITDRRQVTAITQGIGPEGVRRVHLDVDGETHQFERESGQQWHLSLSSSGHAGSKVFSEIAADHAGAEETFFIAPAELQDLAKAAVAHQSIFLTTGATHFASFFDRDGTLLSFAEDVGRHNALDKAVGQLLQDETMARALVAVLSSRLSYEMVQKAAVVGVEILAGFSAATSFSVQVAEQAGISLVGFLRPGRMNVYCHTQRVQDGCAIPTRATEGTAG